MNNSPFLKSISNKLKNTRDDIFELRIFSKVFFDTADIIEANPMIDIQSVVGIRSTENRFFYCFYKTFIQYASIAIRRHSRFNNHNDNSSSRSLIHLLKKLKRNHSMVSRDWYINQIKNIYSSHPKFNQTLFLHEAESMFDSISTHPNLDHLCQDKINTDIEKLTAMSKDICDYVDKNIAHLEISSIVSAPDIEDIKNTINYLSGLTEKYIFFFNDSSIDIDKLNNQSWKYCFKFPWIDQN